MNQEETCDRCGYKHEDEEKHVEGKKERKVKKEKKDTKDIFVKSENATNSRKIVLKKKDKSVNPQLVSKGKSKSQDHENKKQKPNVKNAERGLFGVSIAKKALLIGINYTGSASQLNGCINDAQNLSVFLKQHNYFNDAEISMMTDDKQGPLRPTRANILKQFSQLVQFAKNNKGKEVRLFVSYSGHGTGVRDRNGDESDGQDEALCPVDYNLSGFIIDDEIRSSFIDKLPSNVKLVMLVDACHSATMLDLKYGYMVNAKDTYTVSRKALPTSCEVISLSGCRDNQTSADAWEFDPHENKNEAQGAMTASFIANYKDGITYTALIEGIRKWLAEKRYAQVPQLCSGKLVDTNARFLLCTFDTN